MRADLVHLVAEAPPEDDDFGVVVTAYIGPAGGEGAELFELTVCTSGWLAENVATPKGFAFLRHHLVIDRWDEALVERRPRPVPAERGGHLE